MQVLKIFKIFVTCISILPNILAMEYQYNGGHKIPSLGLGTFTVTNETELTYSLNKALEIGYRHIDTAAAYNNEQFIGKVLNEWISSGKLKREDIFITTKIHKLFPDELEDNLKLSLKKLQLSYVDLYLIHTPIAFQVTKDGKVIFEPSHLEAMWKKMEEQVDAGRAKTIGISNFNITQIKRIQKIAKIQPANLQVETHLYLQQSELRKFAKENNITVVAYSPLGSPGINKFVQKFNITKDLRSFDILHDPEVQKIAEKHSKTTAQIALRFLIQSDLVAIPKSTNPKRLKENFDVFDFTLDDDDMRSLKKLDKGENGRIVDLKDLVPNIQSHPEYPYQDSQ